MLVELHPELPHNKVALEKDKTLENAKILKSIHLEPVLHSNAHLISCLLRQKKQNLAD